MLAWCAGVPLNFANKDQRSFALAVAYSATKQPLWSCPITVQYPGSSDVYVELPVSDAWLQAQQPRSSMGRNSSECAAAAAAAASGQSSDLLSVPVEAATGGAAVTGAFGSSKQLLRQSVSKEVGNDGACSVEASVVVRMSMQVRLNPR